MIETPTPHTGPPRHFAQFTVLALFIGIVFYVPGIIETTAVAIAQAMGIQPE